MSSTLRSVLDEAGLCGRFSGYQARFTLDEFGAGKWWILDGDVRVGVVTESCHFLELTNFLPDAPRQVNYPQIYHAPTAPGDRITLAKWVNAQATTSQDNRLTFSGGRDALTVRMDERWDNGASAWKTCTFAVDEDMGYVVRCEDYMATPALPGGEFLEFCNFLPQNVVDDRPGRIRFPFILWQHPDGRILRWNQNNVGAHCRGNRDHYGARRLAVPGFLGYFGERDRCPVLDLHETGSPISAATCHNMLDEHVHWLLGRDVHPAADGEGRFVFRASYTLASLPGAVGDRLAAAAEVNDLLTGSDAEVTSQPFDRSGQRRTMRFVAFRQQCLCDFTERVDPAVPDRVQAFWYPDDDESSPVSVVSSGGRRTPPCLRIRVAGDAVTASPGEGASVHVTAHLTYRFSAWIKTSLRAGQAFIRVWEWLFHPRNVTAEYKTEAVSGDSDWRSVSVEFTPRAPRAHAVSMEIVVSGEGTVWTDEWLLAPQSPS